VKRTHGHLIFGAIAVAAALVTGGEIARLLHAEEVDAAVVDATNVTNITHVANKQAIARPTPALPEARLIQAVALSKTDYDGALAAYKAIIQSSGREDLRRIALYDLGNLHLEQALRMSDEQQSLPYLELAKQSYRDELRRDPSDWDARYNLERALRLAPEQDDDFEDTGSPPPKEKERSTIADPRMDLP